MKLNGKRMPKQAHVRISDACVAKHGEQGAFEEGLRFIEKGYEELREYWAGKGAQIHIVIAVEKPDQEEP